MALSNAMIEAATASLVREYLSRKGLKSTLEKMDTEYPRDDLSINNRQILMKHVHLEKMMKKNKEEKEPLKSMLEVMTKSFMDKSYPGLTKATENTTQHSYSKPHEVPESPNQVLSSTSKTTLNSNDLIMDDDIESECLTGGGKAGVFHVSSLESSFNVNFKEKTTKRASLSKEKITNNDNAMNVTVRSKSNFAKPTRLSVYQQEQQKKDNINDITVRPAHLEDFLSDDLGSEEQIKNKDSPESFEALLMKGEQRANSLHQIKMQKQDGGTANTEHLYNVETSSIYKDLTKPGLNKKLSGGNESSLQSRMTDLELGDVDEYDMSHVDIKPVSAFVKAEVLSKPISTPLDLRAAIAVKNIVLGSPTLLYSNEWLNQGFTFSQYNSIKYGLVQKKGGPCGVLAAVQACFLQELLFGEKKLPFNIFKDPTNADRSKLLALALSHIFWRAGNYTQAVVTIPSETVHLLKSSKFKQDGITEKLCVYTFSSFPELASFMTQSISPFMMEGSPGVILTMYSAVLSRKIHLLRADFDDPERTTLIGNLGYCTQELVNLLLTGQAVSNVFNDIKQLDSCGMGDPIVLKGLSKRSHIGFLSLFEHYQSCEVGTFYKTPKYPIWVICSESHFSVLFSTKQDLVSDWRAERIFDLYYYDGLANQQEEIRLTINTLNLSFKAPKGSDDDLVPPLELCIRTKWPDAEINWNGYEPIL